MAYRVYLDSNFEPTTREAATLIKAVSDDGRVKFYHPKKENTQKAEGNWITVGGKHFQIEKNHEYDKTVADYGGKHHIIFKTQNENKYKRKEIGEIAVVKREDGNFQVSNLVVHSDFQRQGHATEFYKEMFNYAQSQGKKLFISNDRTDDAKKLHEKFRERNILKDSGEIVFSNTQKAVTDTARADAWLSIGAELGVDFETIARAAWIEGCEHEMEHAATVNGDKITIAKIALDHLREDTAYYTKLRNIEGAGNTQKAIIAPNTWGDVRALTDAEIESLSHVATSDLDAIPEVLPFLNADG